jgi:hypothetical protein
MSSSMPGAAAGAQRSAGAQIQRGAVYVMTGLIAAAVVVAALLMLSTGSGSWAKGIGVGVTLFLLCGAAGAVGAALGFLFGLPRSRFTDELAGTTPSTTTGSSSAKHASTHYLGNSNLIKVSDWLTTIVIGLGLVNLSSLVPALRSLGDALREPLGGAPYSGAAGVSACVTALIGGFLVAYLFTVVRVRQLLEESEDQNEEVPTLERLELPGARAVMSSKGLKLAVGTASGAGDVVVHQDPPAGSTVPIGSPVTVTLGTPGQNAAPAVGPQTGEPRVESAGATPSP